MTENSSPTLTPEFVPFPKIARHSRGCVVTEKIDGTNASIYIADDFTTMLVGSRTRWITPEDDNYGFARWAQEHREELLKLGPGHHFGEWWGSGIQRRYGLTEKRFTLFNTGRWGAPDAVLPACVSLVPVLYSGPFDTRWIDDALAMLAREGSRAAPGFMDPEGIVVYHTAARQLFKKTIKNDEEPKGAHVG